jgi:hypothetical protein
VSDLEERLMALKASSKDARTQEARASATAAQLAEKIAEIEARLRDEFGTEPSKAGELLAAARAEAESLVEAAEEALREVEGS